MILDILYHYFFAGKAKTASVVNKFYTVVQKINTGRVESHVTSSTAFSTVTGGEVRIATKAITITSTIQNYRIQVSNE